MNGSFKIRPYAFADRSELRQLCADNADRGGPIEGIFPDREIAVDLLTMYYTDYEPESTFVAVADGKIVGYVQGSMDNRRYGLATMFLVVPRVLLKALIRGTFLNRRCWQFLGVAFMNWPRLFSWRKESFHSHQAHGHLTIDASWRQAGVGRQLVDVIEQHARQKGVGALTASVHSSNVSACRFFEHIGFQARFKYPTVLSRGGVVEHYEAILYVKDLV